MKYVINIICCFLLLFILEACRHNLVSPSLPVQPFNLDSCKSVRWQEIDTEYLMSFPESMILTDDHLIIQDRKAMNYLFHAINRSSGSLDFEFVKRGNGPNEFLDATFNPFWNVDQKVVTFFDPVKKMLNSFKELSSDSCSKEHFMFLDKKEVLFKSEYVREMFVCNCGYILIGEHGLFDQNRFIILDEELQIMEKFGNYPNVRNLLTDPDKDFCRMFFDTALFKLSPDRKKAVFATYKGALLQFFDLTHCKDSIVNIKSIQSEFPIKKEQISPDHEGWVYGFEDVYVTNDFIYAIYNGETAVDNPMLGKIIIVFDWKGELCKSYRLDINLRCLAVDEDKKIIYVAACKDEGDFFLACIDLS